MKMYKMILAIGFLFLISCQNKVTKQDLMQMRKLNKESDSLAKYLWVDCDSIRKSLRMPILGNNFYSFKKDHYRMWFNPDTTSTPRLVSIIHLIEYIPIGVLRFNYEIGEIQLNDSLSLSYSCELKHTSYSLNKLDLKSKRGTYTYIELSRKEFDSIINIFGSKDILNY